ncbi:non ribosomal peptide synthetase BasB [Loktanella sp. D2R18]|uniref:condensation domain-containing protein n=1 Tax=Rhodobacterales TaxID=204455 RepID=UPI000DE8BFB8|nr:MULTISPECIES: condensation domain-containing protein [Rhodobacterales]MDO6592017.1 condensation domain-containing protein [Yoonia sp. 1_MG-2023]RBW44977.1 non ribosomal peptide synthetase BasB [Loktanella sp. D2R18]
MIKHHPHPDNQLTTRAATPEEARIWLEHQQTENGLKPSVRLVRLPAEAEPGTIAISFVQMGFHTPELTRCYHFDDTGDLLVYSGQATPALQIRWARDTAQSTQIATDLAAESWDLATCGPLRLAVILANDAAHLALIRHPIADDLPDTNSLLQTLAPHTDNQAADITYQNSLPDQTAQIILDEFRLALDAPDMTADCDFFDFGGHSLVATRVIGRLISRHGITLRFNDLFAHTTAASLAPLAEHATPAVDQQANDWAAVAPGPLPTLYETTERVPLSHAQASLWKIYAALGFGPMFNIPFALRFLDPVDETIFASAFRDILERHPALRSRFISQDDTIVQECMPMSEVDQQQWFWHAEGIQSTGPILAAEAGYDFDLARELPIRLRFVRDADGQTLSFLFHHIVLDEWSVNLMMDDLAYAYAARVAGKAPVWEQPIAPFHGFARKQAQAGFDQKALDYWVDALKDASPPKPIRALTARPLTPPTDGHAAEGGWTEIMLDRAISDGLYALSKDCAASLFNTVYAAISCALQRLAGLDDLTIGTSASGRTDPEYFDTVGYFTTVTAHSLRAPGHITPRALIGNVRDMINGSLPHCEIPIDLVEDALLGGKMPFGEHMFEVFIQIHAQNKLNGTLEGAQGPIRFRQIDPEKGDSVLGLQFEVVEDVIEGAKRLRMMMSYRSAHYSAEDVQALISAVENTCAAFASKNAIDRTLVELLP